MSKESKVYDDFDLDADASEVADLVSYSNPADGVHIYGVVFMGLDVSGQDEKASRCMTIVYQKVGTVELANEDDMDSAPASLFSERFLGGDMGKQLLKLRLGQILQEEITGSFRPYVERVNASKMSDIYLKLTTKIHKTKKDGITYENVRILDCEPIEADPSMLPDGFEMYEYTPREMED